MQLDQPGVSAGTGCQIDPHVVFEVDPGAQILLGDRVSIRRGTTIQAHRGSRIHIGNDVKIGENACISSMVAIVIGSGTGVSNQVDIHDHNHAVRDARLGELPLQPWASGFEGAPIVIEKGVLLSNKVTVTAGICIGANVVVDANSVVTRHIQPDTVVAGTPARVIREFTVVRIWQRSPRQHVPAAATFAGFGGDEPRIAVLPMSLGQDDTVLRAVGEYLDGLVIAGFGVGHVPAGLVETLTQLATRIPVVLATRTGAGPVTGKTYAFSGSESDLLARGLIRAGYLDPYKARILLHVVIAARAENAEIRRTFAEIGGYADPPSQELRGPDRLSAMEVGHARP